ncbi:lysophospholipid acyltransferase family protein [Streptomyces sp. CB01881]|uniref:lysophospholipid acyltransferase family protein n=1 Tax=Streptomyces sp. CB01881 TaxID=2078691 RepID=UPI000CDC5C62|nr:lysophospholipid acyltransferase family protein [Streptomyces sp. CB01881]AUY49708.1 1-acyl-sn-glycerol-3-phosphate acyltransferase [Streptomyces sp. CB01881]TYC73099.1 1-acyl-sn-glycerol-3-phosphate acyltransferase [Streptomyces sp. CB01881]
MARRSYASFGNADYGIWYRFAAVLVKPVTTALVKPDWRGWEHLPKEGGFITAVNHNSILDPVIYAHWQYNSGRPPRMLGKSSVFSVPFIGFMLRKTRQIPVFRESTDAARAFRAAVDAVNDGQCVQFYPEGTLTRDPDLWPMTGKTGVARVALMTGAPVIPVAHWGAQEIIPPYGRATAGRGRINLFPRHKVTVAAGPAVDLSRYEGQELTSQVLRDATEDIMQAITVVLAGIRGEEPPAERYDMRTAARDRATAASAERHRAAGGKRGNGTEEAGK